VRQLFFAIVLVGAAFGGGAMVNGPALQGIQHRVSVYMGLNNGDEIASIDLPPSAGDPEADALSKPSDPLPDTPGRGGKVASAVDRAGHRSDAKRKPSPPPSAAKNPEAKSPEPVAPAQPIAPAEPPLAGPSGAPGTAPSVPPPAPLDPGVAPALLASLSPEPAPGAADQPPPNTPASTTAPAASPAPSPNANPPSDAATTGAPASGGGDWAELRRKLKAVGVTRYSIEGETAGRVVFSCLIPLAGKQAVSQQFEGEGEDEFAAARAALRRINLWRATRTTSPASP
jgi:hypothetical protein